MRKFLFLLICMPVFTNAQVKKVKPAATKTQKTFVKKPAAAVNTAPPVGSPIELMQIPAPISGGFLIHGTVSGYPDGTEIKMLNGQTGAIEQTYKIKNDQFMLNGKTAGIPEFKLLGINGQEPFIILFISNEDVTITASKDNFANATASGSPSQNEYAEFVRAAKPYDDMINGKGRFDADFMAKGAKALEGFITKHPNSYVTPLVIFRYNQLTNDYQKLESFYNGLGDNIKTTPMGGYLASLVEANNKMDLGKPLADFTQNDTSGKPVSLSSFKGKYVLVDFWASWCGPCRAENPNVVSSFEKYKNKNFTVLGISLDREKAPWINAIKNDNLNWTQLSDLQSWSNAVAQQFGITQIPQNFLIDPNGNLVGKNLRGAMLEYRLYQLLGQ